MTKHLRRYHGYSLARLLAQKCEASVVSKMTNEGRHAERIISIPTCEPIHCGIQCTWDVNSPSTKPMW
jgi:hypothetical protein